MIILVSVLTILFIGLVPVYADSPLAQYNSGVPVSSIQCADDKILLQSTSGKPYCMSESTAVKLVDRGFLLVYLDEKKSKENILESEYTLDNKTDDSIPTSDSELNSIESDASVSNKTSVLSDKKISITNAKKMSITNTKNENTKIWDPGPPAFWPIYTLTFPEQVRIGEAFDVVLDYSFVIPSIDVDEFGVEFEVYEEPASACSVDYCGLREIWIAISAHVDLINRPDYVFNNGYDRSKATVYPFPSGEVGTIHPPYNNTGPQQEVFTFVINEPAVDYNYTEIVISFQQNSKIYVYITSDDIVHLSGDPIYMIGEGPNPFAQYGEYMPVNKFDPYHLPTYKQLAKSLLEFYSEVPDNYEGWLSRQPILDEDYIKGFFETYPGFAGDAPYTKGFFEQHSDLVQ